MGNDWLRRDENGVNFRVSFLDIRQLNGRTGDKNQPNRDLLQRADVILAADPNGNQELFFGKELLEDIRSNRGGEFDDKLMVVVTLDFTERTEELEFLWAAVETLKGDGSCCYGR